MGFSLFTTQTCAFCGQLKRFLDAKAVKYNIIDITNDRDKAFELQKKYGATSVPILVREDGEYMVGLNMSKLMKML